MIPIRSKIGQGMRIHFEKLLNEYAKNDFIPVYLENNTFNFYLNREVKSVKNKVNDAEQSFAKEIDSTVGKRVWQSGGRISPTTTLNRNVASIEQETKKKKNP